jgi:hypothetical protein
MFVVGFLKADDSFFKNTTYANEKVYGELQTIADDLIDLTLARRSASVFRRARSGVSTSRSMLA